MDPVQFIWLMGAGTFIGGGILGAIAYRNLDPSKNDSRNLKAELDEAKKELESYKANVNSHFDKTSELVNELTQGYVKVYKHLAEGAQELGDGREFTHVLEQHQGKVLISVDSEPSTQDEMLTEVDAYSNGPRPADSEPPETVVTQGTAADDIASSATEHAKPPAQENIVNTLDSDSPGSRPADGEAPAAGVTQGTTTGVDSDSDKAKRSTDSDKN